MPSELTLIKQYKCPKCNAPAMQRCHFGSGDTRIYPYAGGSSGEEAVHPERRNLAISKGVIPDSGPPTAKGISIIRAIIMRKPRGK